MGSKDPWAEMKPQPVKRKATKAEVFAEKTERARTAAEEAVKAGTCPRCGVPVLYAREVGLLTVVEAVPVSEDVEAWIKAQRATYSIMGNRLKLRDITFTRWAAKQEESYTIHPEHTQCGRCAPVPAPKLEKVKDDDPWSDVPPFDPYEGMKRWRCWECNTLIEPKDQGVVISYDGDDMSYYMCHCDKACEPRAVQAQLGKKKKVYPKIDKFGKYAEPKKGEVGFDA